MALADLDGTFTKKAGDRLVAEKFVEEVEFGIPEKRQELKKIFKAWRRASQRGMPDYEQYLIDVGHAYAMMIRGMVRNELLQISGRWFNKRGRNMLQDYSLEVFYEMRKSNLLPILVTGAPFEIASPFAMQLGARHFISMEAEVDENGRYTGEMGENTGLTKGKANVRQALSESRHMIAFGIGDTASDAPLFRGAIEKHFDGDLRGKAVLVNPRIEVQRGAEQWLGEWISRGELRVIPQTTHHIGPEIRAVIKEVIERYFPRKKEWWKPSDEWDSYYTADNHKV